jgi:hypothetical protein
MLPHGSHLTGENHDESLPNPSAFKVALLVSDNSVVGISTFRFAFQDFSGMMYARMIEAVLRFWQKNQNHEIFKEIRT